ncbi:MAG: hypothetical protein H6809_08020 [Phycisphaeraceae bacterium]|nr:hypothetical protein [Phycisphaeraceae bacterium]
MLGSKRLVCVWVLPGCLGAASGAAMGGVWIESPGGLAAAFEEEAVAVAVAVAVAPVGVPVDLLIDLGDAEAAPMVMPRVADGPAPGAVEHEELALILGERTLEEERVTRFALGVLVGDGFSR